MKKSWWLGWCLTLAFAACAAAQEEPKADGDGDPFDPDENAPRLVQVQVEFIELPGEALTKLMYSDSPTVDGNDLRKQLQDMIGKKEASVLETQLIVARTGQKATSESVHEFIYPTEWEKPAGTEDKAKAADGSAPVLSVGPATPTSFDTRNLGSTLEVEPTLSQDNRIVDLRFIPELVWHSGDNIWQEWKDGLGNVFNIRMPHIYTVRINTAVTCIAGKYMLAGLVSPKDNNGDTDMSRKLMVFVKCSIVEVK